MLNNSKVSFVTNMDLVSFRMAIPEDLPAILRLNAQFFDRWNEEKFDQVFEYELPFILMTDAEGQIIGYLIYMVVLDEARIINVVIAKEHHSKGYGQKLIHYVLNVIAQENIRWVLLDVRVSNYPAVNLYTKLGFSILTRRRCYYPIEQNNEDAYFMQLELP
ncbi:MAG: ribosomal protein S18-alanine N-acetyltransferase [Burkholderiales bacterium]